MTGTEGCSPEPLAHVTEDGLRHRLYDHLVGTANRAAAMAAEFGCSEWGYLAGLWHDLGKYSSEFQRYIGSAVDSSAHIEQSKPGRVDHSTAGAILALQRFNALGRLLAYPIAGHHAGLGDWEADRTGRAALSQRMGNTDNLDKARQGDIPDHILDRQLPNQRPKPGSDPALWVRLLFSCLVDADFLDTELFLDPDKAASRGNYRQLVDLLPVFDEYMREKQERAEPTQVNRIRAQVFGQCVLAAAGPPGVNTLTVPTGGGKTLSSLGFALHHAAKHGKRRVIYVIPYTSIIEQTASQFREIFGDAVIEHHSNLDASDESKDNLRTRLACENWDAPLVVTTSVQFFESLFASRTSRCRKLHNIVNSVVVLDEAQLLPPEYLNPILHVLRQLSTSYGVTLLLSTATQPAIGPHFGPGFRFEGLPGMVEIMEDPLRLHDQLRRVDIRLPDDFNQPQPWDALAEELSQHLSVLCIVNRRDDCRILWEKMPEGTFHLSALMCGAHRSARIAEIKRRLKEGTATRVISTQLVEAGVDMDFPVVYRALAGLDSIAQAAGRCNREGKLGEKGKVVVFVPPSRTPPGHLRQAAQIGQRLMSQDCVDILAPDRFISFFKEFYWLQGPRLDQHGILPDLQMSPDFRCSFRSAAQKFHLIDESQQSPVIVTYGNGAKLIRELEWGKPDRNLFRKLQPYVVNIPKHLHTRLVGEGALRELHPGIFVQGHPSLYHEDLGFCADRSMIYEPDELMA